MKSVPHLRQNPNPCLLSRVWSGCDNDFVQVRFSLMIFCLCRALSLKKKQLGHSIYWESSLWAKIATFSYMGILFRSDWIFMLLKDRDCVLVPWRDEMHRFIWIRGPKPSNQQWNRHWQCHSDFQFKSHYERSLWRVGKAGIEVRGVVLESPICSFFRRVPFLSVGNLMEGEVDLSACRAIH